MRTARLLFLTLGILTLALLGAVAPATPAAAAQDDVASFYQGKTITLIVGYSAGGGYDLYARTLARHMGKHIPGNPTITVQNMTGAGSMIATNHLYNVAPKDGTAFATFARGMPMEQLMGTKGVKFDASKFNWIGSMNEEVSVCVARSNTAVKKFDDLFTHTLRVGGTGPGADTDVFPQFLNAVAGTKFDLITGYKGGNDVNLAMERGEVDGRCGWSWSSVKSTRPHWLKDRYINVLIQLALRKHADLPNVPLVMEFAKTEEQQNLFEVVFSRQSMGRPFAAPPGVPTARVRALRRAFNATLEDAEFKQDAEKAKMEISPLNGDEIQDLVVRVMKTPPSRVEKLRAIFKRGK